ncbi:hypothetical protein SNEBB_004118 [Seison nebaliae]|nr:hypothetical protein SNEBB_004118 [Seison nebaliae]
MIHVPKYTVKVYVTHTQDYYTCLIQTDECPTVCDLMKSIYYKTLIPLHKQKLLFRGQEISLYPKFELRQFSIVNGTTVELFAEKFHPKGRQYEVELDEIRSKVKKIELRTDEINSNIFGLKKMSSLLKQKKFLCTAYENLVQAKHELELLCERVFNMDVESTTYQHLIKTKNDLKLYVKQTYDEVEDAIRAYVTEGPKYFDLVELENEQQS